MLVIKLIFLSRVHPKKGLEYLFKALSKVDFKWNLKIVGSGDLDYVEYLKTLSTSLGISNCIEWKGWIGDDQRFDLLASADLFILISENENFANVIIESLSVGTPVIISSEIGLKDYIEQENFGWITPLKTESIEKKLLESLNDKNRRTWIRINAPSIIRSHFSPNSIAKSYIEKYKNHKT